MYHVLTWNLEINSELWAIAFRTCSILCVCVRVFFLLLELMLLNARYQDIKISSLLSIGV